MVRVFIGRAGFEVATVSPKHILNKSMDYYSKSHPLGFRD